MHFPPKSFIHCSLSCAMKRNMKIRNFINNIFSAHTHNHPIQMVSWNVFVCAHCTYTHCGTILGYHANHWHYFPMQYNNQTKRNSIKSIYKWQIVNLRLTKQLSSMENTFRLLDGILISSILYAHIYNNLQVNLLHTV